MQQKRRQTQRCHSLRMDCPSPVNRQINENKKQKQNNSGGLYTPSVHMNVHALLQEVLTMLPPRPRRPATTAARRELRQSRPRSTTPDAQPRAFYTGGTAPGVRMICRACRLAGTFSRRSACDRMVGWDGLMVSMRRPMKNPSMADRPTCRSA